MTDHPHTRLATLGLLLAGVLLVIARAGAQPAPATPTTASPVASPVAASLDNVPVAQSVTDRVTIHVSDTEYRPAFVQATNGHDLTITIVNDGTRPHGFAIEDLDIDVTVQPGQSATAVVRNRPLGDFHFRSTLPGDDALEGELTFYI